MQDWTILFAAITALSTAGFVVIAVLWLRRLRESVSTALAEAANQQVRTAQRLNDAVSQVQKQQHNYEQQIHNLAEAGLRLRQDLVNVTTKLEHNQAETNRGDQTLH